MKELDSIIAESDSIELREKTELEGVADIMFTPKEINASINISEFERTNIVVCDIISGLLKLDSLGITHDFKQLSQSIGGWKTSKFVEVGQGRNELKHGASIGEKFANWISPNKQQ